MWSEWVTMSKVFDADGRLRSFAKSRTYSRAGAEQSLGAARNEPRRPLVVAPCAEQRVQFPRREPVQITKLPPGKAFGADDLRNWGHQRLGGRAGSYSWKEAKKQRKRAKILSKRAGRKVKAFE